LFRSDFDALDGKRGLTAYEVKVAVLLVVLTMAFELVIVKVGSKLERRKLY